MAELRNIRWGKLLKTLCTDKYSLEILSKSHSLQWALTYCLRQQDHIVLDYSGNLILEYRGLKFLPHKLHYPRLFEALDRYDFEELREDDIVVDAGANIGAFSIPASCCVKKVIAIEPMVYTDLISNIKLNEIYNISPINGRVAGHQVDCQEYKLDRTVEVLDLETIIENEDPTYLRMDIGGSEWFIEPFNILEHIRHFEGEFHLWSGENRKNSLRPYTGWKCWKDALDSLGFSYRIRWSSRKHWIYVSADKEWNFKEEQYLKDGSFMGKSKDIWRVK
jgi:hypothetical protein